MKINIIPLNKLALLSAALGAVMLAFSPNANALTLAFDDQYVVGTISPGAPADPADVATYVNYMTGLTTGGSGTFAGQTITRSNNTFASLPNAVFDQNDPNAQGTTTSVNLGAGGLYTYLFAKYDGQNDNSLVWYVGNLSGVITIPQDGPLGHGLSGWILFGPGTPGVPDGGTTVMLLGTALGALGMARRFLKI